MDSVFLLYLKNNLERDIKENEIDSPTVSYKTTCNKQIKAHESFITTFKILYSGIKGRLKDNLKPEEKIKISKGNFTTKGSIISIEDDEVVIECGRHIDLGDYNLDRISNYNNEIVLKNLESFIKNKKEIPHEILQGWTEDLKIRIMKRYFVKLESENEILNFLCYLNRSKKDKDLKSINFKIQKFSMQIEDYDRISKSIDRIIQYESNKRDINSIDIESYTPSNFFDDTLNLNQKAAVTEWLRNKSYKIIGPPGTGKTRTIVEILCQLLKNNKDVLVCGPSNVAIDNIIERFKNSQFYAYNEISFYRLGSSQKGLTKYNLQNQVSDKTKFVEKEKNEKNFKRNLEKLQTKYKEDIQKQSRVVFGTLFSSLKEYRKFDWILVDEACQATDVETFLCLVKAKSFILIGDPNQLCPKSTSLFEKLHLRTFLLNVQYRMCSKLISFSNLMFYNEKITSFKKDSNNLICDSPIVLVDTDCSDYNESDDEKSKINLGEVDIVVKIVSLINSRDIGIITPYSAQSVLLRSRLDDCIEVKTVDGFQGREKDFIILSLVRSNNMSEFGFLDDYKRLNVAITRCKKGLIVVGNSLNFRKSEIFSKFFKHLEQNFISIDPTEIEDFFTK
ncbi:hypothetical protein P3W45_001155 [Vairimorpha bombi]|jgi:DNA polymerase alpha-associated DNA helicase A